MIQQFFYKAMDAKGQMHQGQLDASNLHDLEDRLQRMDLDLIHGYPKKAHHYLPQAKITRRELITFCFHMEQLSRAGVPLLDGLDDLRQSLPQSRFHTVLSSLIENIKSGKRLHEAMKSYPDIFDDIFVNLVYAGEESGQLTRVFKHLTENLKWQDEIHAKSKKLIIYPAFLFGMLWVVFLFLMLYLIPQLMVFLVNVGAELPLHTRILITLSNFFQNYWYLVIIVPIALFFAAKLLLWLFPSLHYYIDYIKLKIWLIGAINEKIILARFANFFALLYSAGITVPDSLALSKKLAGNLVIAEAIEHVSQAIAEGKSISDSFAQVDLFPPLILRMVKIGETTGALDLALTNISYFYDRESKEAIDYIQALIEPIMTVSLGLLLGWVMLSILGPVYDVIVQFSY